MDFFFFIYLFIVVQDVHISCEIRRWFIAFLKSIFNTVVHVFCEHFFHIFYSFLNTFSFVYFYFGF